MPIIRSASPASELSLTSAGFTLWLTGLPGAGKSTLARLLADRLHAMGRKVEVLDGDELRTSLSRDLGFSQADRDEHIARIGYLCELLSRNGVIAVVAAVSPSQAARDSVRARLAHFFEIYVHCPLDVLVARDPKGLYCRALKGEVRDFTGVSAPYEPPMNPELTIESDREAPQSSADKIWLELVRSQLIYEEPNLARK